MPVKQYKVNTSKLVKDMQNAEQIRQVLVSSLQQISSELDRMDMMWEGEDKDAYKKAYTDDIKAGESILKELKMLSNYGKQSGENYEKCEKKIQGLIDAIRG